MRQSARRDLLEQLAGMGHSALPQRNATGALAGHRAQAVVRIREAETRRRAGKPNSSLQQEAARDRHASGATKEAAPERISCTVCAQGVDKSGDVGGTVLPVGIKGHDVIGDLLEREFDAGLQRCALT